MGIQQLMVAGGGAGVNPPVLTLNANFTGTAGVSNGSIPSLGTFTGTVTSYTVNSGPSAGSYSFSGGNVAYSGPLSLGSGGIVSLTATNAGGSSTSSGNLTVNGIGFALSTTNRSFAANSAINPFAPRTTILATTTPNNVISSGSVASGSLPPGTTLQFNQGGNGDVIIGGTPTTPGTYNFTLQVFDGGVSNSSPATSGTITITIT